ncbi:DNA-binding protein WhiA [Staphylococcus aureus]
MKAKEILDELGILKDGIFTHEIDHSMIQNQMIMKALRGAFLAGGSVNNPETSS